ncbi:hypothetical protein RHECNPAF_1260096 [Rhizobium etli CNPAF512]|nr:hypothetical protein RHECNPAF_1260096 [Rhizobium etli CNPAF512]
MPPAQGRTPALKYRLSDTSDKGS